MATLPQGLFADGGGGPGTLPQRVTCVETGQPSQMASNGQRSGMGWRGGGTGEFLGRQEGGRMEVVDLGGTGMLWYPILFLFTIPFPLLSLVLQ